MRTELDWRGLRSNMEVIRTYRIVYGCPSERRRSDGDGGKPTQQEGLRPQKPRKDQKEPRARTAL